MVWAIFNTALRELSREQGNLVFRGQNQSILTKAELMEFVSGRNDLIHSLCSYGADIPTTNMHWKKEGRNLEWIVRQMMWNAPWIAGSEDNIGQRRPRRAASQRVNTQEQIDVERVDDNAGLAEIADRDDDMLDSVEENADLSVEEPLGDTDED